MKDKLPEQIIKRKKMGFGIPIIKWMRGELYGYLKEHLLESDGPMYDFLDKRMVARLLEDHKNGVADYSNHLWSVLLLKFWLDHFFYGKEN